LGDHRGVGREVESVTQRRIRSGGCGRFGGLGGRRFLPRGDLRHEEEHLLDVFTAGVAEGLAGVIGEEIPGFVGFAGAGVGAICTTFSTPGTCMAALESTDTTLPPTTGERAITAYFMPSKSTS